MFCIRSFFHDLRDAPMEKPKGSKKIFMLLLLSFLPIILIIFIFLAGWLYSPDKTDYKGEFKNSSGEVIYAEIKTTGDMLGKSSVILRDEQGRTVEYRVQSAEPEKSLPEDMLTFDIDDDSYIIWVCEKDGGELIYYSENNSNRCRFWCGSEINYVSDEDISAINAIEQSGVLDKLPDNKMHKSKWAAFFKELKQKYVESETKEDSV